MSTDEASETADAGMPRGKRLPLNSRRLTAAHLKQIATAMELPVTGSTDQLRQLIEGKLQTEGHETTNILVVVEETSLVEMKKVQKPSDASAKVPLVRVRSVQSVRILPSQSAVVNVQLEKTQGVGGPLIVEPTRCFEDSNDLRFDHTLVEPGEDGSK